MPRIFERAPRDFARRANRDRRFRPVVELMEERVVPAVVDTVNFTEATYVNNSANLGSATGLAWAPDGSNRLFVARKAGQVRIVQDGVLLTTPFASVSPIYTGSECGLIGITFDRDYVNNRYVYLFVTVAGVSPNFEQQIIRYTDTNNIGTAKTTIVSGLPTKGNNHDGGGVGIGADNKLYWSIGDQGDGTGVNTNLTTLAAKVGRANLDGSPVADNPYNDHDGINEPADYIWARGFRNPFTLTFQESTGQLWIDDVGTNYEQIFKVNKNDHAGWNILEGNQTAGFIQPEVIYKTNNGGTDSRTIAAAAANGAVRTNNIATFTISGSLPQAFLQPGNKITISGVANSSFNGSFDILTVPSTTTFTVAQNGVDATSGGGAAVTALIGSGTGAAVSGGVFYTATSFPASFQGSYFFGDYISGNIMVVALDGSNNVVSVNRFSTGVTNVVDLAVGPDGALYSIGAGGDGIIRRTSYNAPAQNIVVSQTAMNLLEGGRQGFSVRLATSPAGNVTVNVARSAGDSDLTVASGATLTFTPTNFSVPQAVVLDAAQDPDITNDSAAFAVSSAGLPSQTVNAAAIDNDTSVVTTTTLTAVPNATTGGSMVTFTATITPSPGDLGTVAFLENGTPLTGAGAVAVSGGVAVFTTSSLPVGSHPIVAAYSGAAGIQASASAPQTVVVATAPQVVSVRPNGNLTSFSRVGSLVVVFDRPVQLDANPFALALHQTGVTWSGDPKPTGYGAVPTSLSRATSDNITWTVTFNGNTENGADGLRSLQDGVYDFTIDPSMVHPLGVPGVNMTGSSTTTFHRLFGDTDVPIATGPNYQAVVNPLDNSSLLAAFNNAAGYQASLDFNGDGVVNPLDYYEFLTRFNLILAWSV